MDLRVEHIFQEEMSGDTSFTEKSSGFELLFRSNKYTQQEMRETWHRGIKHGIEIGLRKASLEGQLVDLYKNTTTEKEIEFLKKFHQLSVEYNCSIKYHPQLGMIVLKTPHHQ